MLKGENVEAMPLRYGIASFLFGADNRQYSVRALPFLCELQQWYISIGGFGLAFKGRSGLAIRMWAVNRGVA